MAKGRELKGRIKSVENTRKITRTMEMVATSKMKRAQDRVVAARPYAAALGDVISSLYSPDLAERFPLSLHGVGLSVAGPERPDPAHLTALAALAEPTEDGLSARLSQFWAGWQDLANTPDSGAARATDPALDGVPWYRQLWREVAEGAPAS